MRRIRPSRTDASTRPACQIEGVSRLRVGPAASLRRLDRQASSDEGPSRPAVRLARLPRSPLAPGPARAVVIPAEAWRRRAARLSVVRIEVPDPSIPAPLGAGWHGLGHARRRSGAA